MSLKIQVGGFAVYFDVANFLQKFVKLGACFLLILFKVTGLRLPSIDKHVKTNDKVVEETTGCTKYFSEIQIIN